MFEKLGKFICAILIIAFFMWRFFLRERIPHELTFPFSYSYLFIAILIILLHVYSIYIKFYTPKPPKNPILITLSKYAVRLNNYIDSVYYAIYTFLAKSAIVLLIILSIGEYLVIFKRYYPCQYIYILFNISPRLIVALSFFIDVVCYNYMYYFYYAVYLLLFPVLLRAIRYLLDQWAQEWQDYVRVYLDIDVKSTLRSDGLYDNLFRYRWKYPELEQTEFHCVNYYKAYDNFALHVLFGLEDYYKLDEYKKVNFCNSFITVLYIFSWGYILFKILVNFICFICLIGSIGF